MILNINLTHLKYFYDSVLLKSITSAARENFVSQSAISQGISNLERTLQVTLTTHQRQGFRLTPEGEIVFYKAKKIFAELVRLRERISDLKNEISGEVQFASTNAIAQFYIAPKFLKLKAEYPLVKLGLERGSLPFIHESLTGSKVAFALAVDAPEFAIYEKKVLSKGYFHLYKDKSSSERNIFVDNPDTFEVKHLRKAYLEKHNKELKIEDALFSWTMVATLVLNGCGIGFLPEFVFGKNENVEKVDLGIPPMEYSICAFWPKNSKLSFTAESILNVLVETPKPIKAEDQLKIKMCINNSGCRE